MQHRLPEMIAHRGESHDAPENTLAAFELAWQRGADAVELDVRLTADGRLVCIHDADTLRTCGVAEPVHERTLAQLQQLDAGSWKSPRYEGEKMPALEEALATIPPGKRLLIEIKLGPEAVPALVDALTACGTPAAQAAVMSFNLETCRETRRRLPGLKVYYLSSFKWDELSRHWSPAAEQLIADAKAAGANGLDLSWRGPVDESFVQKVRAAGLELYIWTINDPEVACRFATFGVDGITTDRAAWLCEQLS